MVKVKASPEGKEIINEAHERKIAQNRYPKGKGGWGLQDNKSCWQALMRASEYLFKKAVARNFGLNDDDDDTSVDVEKFRNWIIDSQIFYPENSQDFVLDYLEDIRKRKQTVYRKITISNIDEIIEKFIKEKFCRFQSLNNNHFRDFIKGEKFIDESIFRAFCYALELEEEWENLVERPAISSSEKKPVSYLSQNLNEFNHRDQIEKIKEKIIFTKNNQVTAFLFVNKCPYGQTWMLRRIEHEMKNKWYRDRPVEVHNLNKKIYVDIQVLKSRFQKYISTDFSQKQLILILNIDNYLLEVEQIIKDLWRPLLHKAHQQRPNSVLLFLMSQELENDLQEKWRDNQILGDYMAQLPCPSFTEKELGEVISNIAEHFAFQFQQYLEESPKVIAKNLMNEYQTKCQQNASINPTRTRNLLMEIYKLFKCKYSQEEFNRQWQNYPPT